MEWSGGGVGVCPPFIVEGAERKGDDDQYSYHLHITEECEIIVTLRK